MKKKNINNAPSAVCYSCNPINMSYRYQFHKNPMDGTKSGNREAADPPLIFFRERYYLFASMTLSVLVSEDLVHWEEKRLPDLLPLDCYAPDARVVGDFVYLSFNEEGDVCNFYRTQNIVDGPYEKLPGSFSFSDPNLFADEDGRLYFYWGLSCTEPIYGVELDPLTMKPIGVKQELITGNPQEKGYERIGEDNSVLPCGEEELKQRFRNALEGSGAKEEELPPGMRELILDRLRDKPYLEGAWINRFQGKYYLQYATPGTQYNVYGDGVYVSDAPLGPFRLAENNPYSYQPGGFLPGAGHGSTIEDRYGNLWHAATMRISVNHPFERRIGLWPAGLDEDGELFCNQRYGDWPRRLSPGKRDPWEVPDWYLLSYRKPVLASSFCQGREPERAVDEDVRTWWQAAGSAAGEWLELDLGAVCQVHAVQINFADEGTELPIPEGKPEEGKSRYIEERPLRTRWLLEGSSDRREYQVLEEKREAETDLSHDLVVMPDGCKMRYLRLTIEEVPYAVKPCISGLRVFGRQEGRRPEQPVFTAVRTGELDMEVSITQNGAVGYLILWGHAPEKLYHSYLVYGQAEKNGTTLLRKRIGALVVGQEYTVRVDAFNESGITEGITKKSVTKNS